MNSLTLDIAHVAFGNFLEHKRNSSTIRLDDLIAEMDSVWIQYRDVQIERWADRLMAVSSLRQLSTEKRESLVSKVGRQLMDFGIHWEIPLWDPEGDDEAHQLREEQFNFLTWSVACMWWLAVEGSKIAPLLDYADGQLREWLEARQAEESMLVRKRTKGGGRVVQVKMF